MKKTLIVVDMQNDFITGSLGTAEAVAILPAVIEKIEAYRKAGDDIIYTRDTHGGDYLDTNEGKHLPVVHCVKDTPGWEIAPGVYQGTGLVIDKPAFGWTGWDKMEFEEVELIGLCTDICVVSNALIIKALFPEIPVRVDASCTAGVTPQSKQEALGVMRMCQIDIINGD